MILKYCGTSEIPIRSCSLHRHAEWEIVYQKSGNSTTTVDGVPYQLKRGDVIAIPPNAVHEGRSDTYFSDMYVRPESAGFPRKVFIVHDQDGSLRTLFNMILKTYIEKEPNHHAICNGLLETICATVDRNRAMTYKHPFVVELKRRIYENMADPGFSVTDEIQKMGYNPDHVRRSFYADVGVSPHRYLTNLRLTLAKKRLQNESFMSIEGVARECGFGDAFYFSRLFKKVYGLSTREYRWQEEDN